MTMPINEIRINEYTFGRPFRAAPAFAASVGAPIGSWLVNARRGDEVGFLTTATPEVLAAFGITEAKES